MALFGGSKSSTASTTITEVHNVGASEGSIAASENSVVNVLDAGVIDRAFDFSNESLDAVFRFANASLGLAKNTVSEQQRSTDDALMAALSSRDEAQSGGAERLLIFGGLALAGFVALVYFTRG